MKYKYYTLPVLALILVASWIGSTRQSISALEKESALLKQQLAARLAGSGPDAPPSKHRLAKRTKSVDWTEVTAILTELRQSGDHPDGQTFDRFQQMLPFMNTQQLASLMEEIAALDLSDDLERNLRHMILWPFFEKDPEFALTQYLDRINDEPDGMRWPLAGAMKEWSKKDTAKAVAWFDKQIANGKFDAKSLDGKGKARLLFEGALIGSLISNDPEAAARRLKSLPEDHRADAMQNKLRNTIAIEDQLAYANLIRAGVPEKDQAQTLARQATLLGDAHHTKITEYLDRIDATPTERAACVKLAVESEIQLPSRNKKITREDIDAMREWATRQAPGTTDEMTGAALATATAAYSPLGFSEAATLATQYHEASGNDDVLIGFLTNRKLVKPHGDEARALAEKISDVKKREEILGQFQQHSNSK